MTKYTMESEHASLIGMDVHARQVTARGIDLERGEVVSKTFRGETMVVDLAGWIRELFSAPHYAAYESGCTGFQLCRDLGELGIQCDVAAVSSVARSPEDKNNKNDKVDARRMLAELLNPTGTVRTVWRPDIQTEGARDLARAYHSASVDAKRAKQRTSALLLRHGHVFSELTASGKLRKAWGRSHRAWLEGIVLPDAASQATLRACIAVVDEASRRAGLLAGLVAGQAALPRRGPYVDALCCMKGIDVTAAFILCAEIGDFLRFSSGRKITKWAGLVPTESTSDSKRRTGNITKAGNSFVRFALVEGLGTVGARNNRPKIQPKGTEAGPVVLAMCREADARVREKYLRLTTEKNKLAQVAKVACAGEALRWVWAIGCAVQRGTKDGGAA